jgi:hypothetical protein
LGSERKNGGYQQINGGLTDLGDRDIRLVNTDDLYDLRNFALDRKKWREMSKI